MQGRTENKEEIRDGIKVERNLMKVNAIDKKTNNQKKQNEGMKAKEANNNKTHL